MWPTQYIPVNAMFGTALPIGTDTDDQRTQGTAKEETDFLQHSTLKPNDMQSPGAAMAVECRHKGIIQASKGIVPFAEILKISRKNWWIWRRWKIIFQCYPAWSHWRISSRVEASLTPWRVKVVGL